MGLLTNASQTAKIAVVWTMVAGRFAYAMSSRPVLAMLAVQTKYALRISASVLPRAMAKKPDQMVAVARVIAQRERLLMQVTIAWRRANALTLANR